MEQDLVLEVLRPIAIRAVQGNSSNVNSAALAREVVNPRTSLETDNIWLKHYTRRDAWKKIQHSGLRPGGDRDSYRDAVVFTEIHEDEARKYFRKDWRSKNKMTGLPSNANVVIVVSAHDFAKASITLYKSFCEKVWWTVRTVDTTLVDYVIELWYAKRVIFQNDRPEYITARTLDQYGRTINNFHGVPTRSEKYSIKEMIECFDLAGMEDHVKNLNEVLGRSDEEKWQNAQRKARQRKDESREARRAERRSTRRKTRSASAAVEETPSFMEIRPKSRPKRARSDVSPHSKSPERGRRRDESPMPLDEPRGKSKTPKAKSARKDDKAQSREVEVIEDHAEFEDEIDYEGNNPKFTLNNGREFSIMDFLIWFQTSIVRIDRECKEIHCRRIDFELLIPTAQGHAEGEVGLPADPKADPSSEGQTRSNDEIYIFNGVPWLETLTHASEASQNLKHPAMAKNLVTEIRTQLSLNMTSAGELIQRRLYTYTEGHNHQKLFVESENSPTKRQEYTKGPNFWNTFSCDLRWT